MNFFTTQRKQIAGQIEERVCEVFETNREELLSTRRPQHVARARQMVWWILRKWLHISFVQLGEHYGKHHTTILTGVRSFESAPEFSEWSAQAKRIVELPEITAELERLSPYSHPQLV